MKRLTTIIAYVLLSLAAVIASFSLLTVTSRSAYAHEYSRDRDDGDSRVINETHPIKADGEVRVDNLAGNVKIRGWDRNEVRITGELSPSADHLQVDNDANGISIRVVLPHDSEHFQDDDGSDLVIDLPRGAYVNVSTVSADVTVADVNGQQTFDTVSGNITLSSSSTRVEAKSVSGDVTVTGSGPKAKVNASSISGTVTVTSMDGTLDAGSISGEVNASNNKLSGATISSTSGDLRFEGSLQKGGFYEFHNVSGDVEVTVGKPASAHFDVSSFSGDIHNSFGPKPTRVSKYSPGEELHFVNDSGDAQVTIRTLSGEIRLED